MHGAKSDEDPLLSPRGGHEEGSLIPNGAQVIPQFAGCCDVVIRRGNRHLHHFSYLRDNDGPLRIGESLLTKINIHEALISISLCNENNFDKWDALSLVSHFKFNFLISLFTSDNNRN